eukprot:CAMPEP_0171426622 /NCGR_PEP_ID=MMETSP0881-20121228/4087_1 /TAXON_ID=67004 /ORGANISM="Thalassiosira weissflogii, Strain CCMP1336" /LENGTH=48 /DNA_ID= /DNA_START= /DNA_END= /DNA_ORIENTATION=
MVKRRHKAFNNEATDSTAAEPDEPGWRKSPNAERVNDPMDTAATSDSS